MWTMGVQCTCGNWWGAGCNQSAGGSPKWRHPIWWTTLENKQGGMAASCSSHPCAMPGLDPPTQCVHGSTAAWKGNGQTRGAKAPRHPHFSF